MLDSQGRELASTLVELFSRGVDERLDDAEFDRLARDVFRYQYERNAPYAAYCRRRDRVPGNLHNWRDIPAVPTAAFKEVPLVSGPVDRAEAIFRTSGTTRGPERRGTHHLLDLTLYHSALLPNFAAYLLPDAAELPMLSLIPPDEQMADSSLAHMIGVVVDRLGGEDSGYFASVGSGIDDAALSERLRRCERDREPVFLLGTTIAFARWLERVEKRREGFQLPAGSRLMDTGGSKGYRDGLPADATLTRYRDLLDLPPEYCVNEYGMTELCSQFYDAVLRNATKDRPPDRSKRPPPWVRTVVVDPDTLEPVPAGESGLLRHFDLANLGSVMAVQTMDLGRAGEGEPGTGFQLLGRASGAPPRGCSIAMDLLLDAAREARE